MNGAAQAPRLQQNWRAEWPELADDLRVKKTGVDRFATSGFVRFVVVVTWFVISTMAFFSRYERMTGVLATLMASLILIVTMLGLCWAAFPSVQKRERSRQV